MTRKELRELGIGLRVTRVEGRAACAAEAGEVKAAKVKVCDAARTTEASARERRSSAWKAARGVARRVEGACLSGLVVVGVSKKRPVVRKGIRAICRAQARHVEATRYREHRDAKVAHAAAQGERREVCSAARGARRVQFEACMGAVRDTYAVGRRGLEVQEAERRQEAKKARGGRRPPVSPAERDQEELGRARADLEAYDRGTQALFEQRPQWFLKKWKGAREKGRRLSLAELVAQYAEESPEEVQEALNAEAEAWVKEQERKWRAAS